MDGKENFQGGIDEEIEGGLQIIPREPPSNSFPKHGLKEANANWNVQMSEQMDCRSLASLMNLASIPPKSEGSEEGR